MADEASHQLARQVVARLCQPLGWQGIQNGACDVLADLMKRYILTLGKSAAAYVANANRTEALPDDVVFAFKDLDLTLDDLSTYARLVDSSTLPPLPQFPLPRQSSHIYTPPATSITRPRPSLSEEEEEEEEDVIPPHLPPLPSKKTDDDKDDAESGVHDAVDRDDVLDVSDTLVTPADPNRGLPQLYHSRSRLSSELSEDGGGGGEGGGSRRGSISDMSGANLTASRGLATHNTETSGAPTSNSSNVHVGAQRQQKLHLVDGEATRVSLTQSSDRISVLEPREVSVTMTTGVTPMSVSLDGARHVEGQNSKESLLHDATLPSGVSNQGEGEGEGAVIPSRPPPLRLMSSGGHEPLSPSIPSSSPGSGDVGRPLPLLSPLCTTPAPSHNTPPVSKETLPTAMVTTPQLTPTNNQTRLPSLLSPISTHPPSPVVTQISKDPHAVVDKPSLPPKIDTPQMLPPTSDTLMQGQTQKPSDSCDVLVTSEAGEVAASSAASPSGLSLRTEAKEKEEEEGEGEGSEDEMPLPVAAGSVSQEELTDAERRDPEIGGETGVPSHPSSPPRPLEPRPSADPSRPSGLSPFRDTASMKSEEEEQDNESVVSTSSSTKPSSPDMKREIKTVFLGTVAKDETNGASSEMKLLEHVVTDLSMEGGGEGGVASILDSGEQEMDLPDIDKLEMSESEESASSDSSSASDVEIKTILADSEKRGKKGSFDKGAFLQPPRAASVRSSSYSLASTPSVSPSPSPIPHSAPSQHSIPGSDVPIPYQKLSQVQRMREASKASITPTDSDDAVESLVVTLSRHLVASLRGGKKGEGGRGRGREGRKGGGRGRGREGREGEKHARLAPQHRKSQLTKSTKRSTITHKTPDIVIDPPEPRPPEPRPLQPLVISIPRNVLHHDLLGVTSDLQSQSGFTFSNEEDDDIIVTHSSAQQVKSNQFGTKSSVERINVCSPSHEWLSRRSPSSDIAQYPVPPEGTGGGVGVWRRELDISEMGLLPPAPSDPQVKIIPQPSSSSSSSGDSESETGDTSSHSSPSPSPPPHSHTRTPSPTPTPSPWQRPIRSEDEESTSSSATGGSGGLKLKLKISKALLPKIAVSPAPEKVRKRGPVPMATTSRGGQGSKRGRRQKPSRTGSNIPQIKLPKFELPVLPGSLPRQRTTPTSGVFPSLKLPAAVSPSGEVWFCPHCSKPDDGSPMIGCDGPCEGWYHWYCAGIVEAPPENEKWYCPSCAGSKKKSRKRIRRH